MIDGYIQLHDEPELAGEAALRQAWAAAGRPPELFTYAAASFLIGGPVPAPVAVGGYALLLPPWKWKRP